MKPDDIVGIIGVAMAAGIAVAGVIIIPHTLTKDEEVKRGWWKHHEGDQSGPLEIPPRITRPLREGRQRPRLRG